MLRDIQSVLRQARRTPSFVITAALTLALGVGANTAIFSVINGFMRPLPIPHPDRLIVVALTMPGDETGLRYRFSLPSVNDYRARIKEFSDIFGFDLRLAGITVNGKTTQFLHSAVTGNFFEGLQLQPAAGRLFKAGEGEHPDDEANIVLSHAYWMKHFGGDRGAVGMLVKFDGFPARIIGVAPEGFNGTMEGTEMDGYVPLSLARRPDAAPGRFFTDREARRILMFARMKPGVTLAQAQAAVDVVAAQIAAEHPDTEKGTGAQVMEETLARPIPWRTLSTLLPFIRFFLLVLSGVVLLIACMNVANILLVRVTIREREMAVRASLGAGRARLIRLLLIESVMLATLGTALGVVFGKVLSTMFVGSINIGSDLPFRLDANFDWKVFTYAALAAIATGVVVGILPARRASRTSVAALLHDGGRSGSASRSRQRIRNILVVAQVAGSLVLLIIAGLFVRNLTQAQRVEIGFDPHQVFIARLDTLNIGMNEARSNAFYDELHRRLQNLPGVESASLSFTVPLSWIIGSYVAGPEGAREDGTPKPAIGYNGISPDYFTTLRIPIKRGRGFTSEDVQGSKRVAIINEVLATRFWPNEDPIGKRLVIPMIPGEPWEVVGVAGLTKNMAVFEYPLPHFYLPQAQNPSFLRTLSVRSTAPIDDVRLRVEREIAALEPELPVSDAKSLEEVIGGNIGFVLFRTGAGQATSMGLLGLALAVIGVYGVVSYQTAQREKEIGIRMALGAVPWDVLRLVLGQGVTMVFSGVLIGLLITLVATTALGRMIVLISPTDPLTFITVTGALVFSAILACYLPALRATRIEPVVTLRQE